MTATSEIRGNKITHDGATWGDLSCHEKCQHCGERPDVRGYDACLVDLIDGLNMIDGVKTHKSCCGHGKRHAWLWFTAEGKKAIFDAIAFINPCFANGDRIETEVRGNNELVYVAHINVASKMAIINAPDESIPASPIVVKSLLKKIVAYRKGACAGCEWHPDVCKHCKNSQLPENNVGDLTTGKDAECSGS